MPRLPRAILAAPALALAIAAPARAAEPPLSVDLGDGVSIELVYIPAGSFTQGSPPSEKDRKDDEAAHQVTISRPFYLGKTPVTVAQFGRFVTATGYRTEAEKGTSGGYGWNGKDLEQRQEFTWKSPGFPQKGDHPVTIVTYGDAVAFTAWLSRKAGRAVTLPTEAQWEYAYRAGSTSAYYGGAVAAEAPALGWFKQNAGKGTHPVGQKKPNTFGLYDMAGNVFAWCADWYGPYPEGDVKDPQQTSPGAEKRRVLRGGSWLKDIKNGRAAARNRSSPGSRNADNGFRVAAARDASASSPVPASPPSPPPSSPPGSSAPSAGTGVAIGAGCLGTMAVMGAGFIALIVLLVRRSGGGGKGGIRVRVGADGFWIDAPREDVGATLHYRYRGRTGRQEGHVVLEASDVGQFVYTGAAPQSVEIVQVLRPQAAPQYVQQAQRGSWSGGGQSAPRQQQAPRQQVVVQHHHHHHTDHRRDEEPFRGYPSAY